MRTHKLTYRIGLAVAAFALAASSPSVAQTRSKPVPKPRSPQQQVQAFLKFHLANDGGFTAKTFEARKAWLAPALYRALRQELARGAAFQAKHPDEVPYFDGDVFVNSQEIPTGHRILPMSGSDVPVEFRFGPSSRMVRYRMRLLPTKPQKQWLIEDVITDGESLMKTLQRPVYMPKT